eukprot:CAMPEP_0178396504 /NCGR_PEP_ID=MMETSP0689_2-20121128/13762_1 /TAXON_ID=160604 /ORGANISM="Amphidinium massartii, Strain CS-259" /LENGTH=657 /DNA_ID=CAMNT_0020017179 /DNA_START=330 /DNA_END=2303 /DNA_ORIENTATION=+
MGCCFGTHENLQDSAHLNGGGGSDVEATKTSSSPSSPKSRLVMGKYDMKLGDEDKTGEGTSSICRKGVDRETGEEVAIKVYKNTKDSAKNRSIIQQKFLRQIEVLQELQQPMAAPADARLWHQWLADASPEHLFMKLIDYSKTETGEPGPDPTDGQTYVVTELAQYSLKDYLAYQNSLKKNFTADAVRRIAYDVVLVVAGLHSKGLVHVDLKPENLMMFNGKLKLIDVDGCVKAGTSVSVQDSTISFSPCYCAPEWARFLINDHESRIVISPGLDVWSVGMTICELVTLEPMLKSMYANFLRNASSHREAGFLFMEWLIALPKSIVAFDELFVNLLREFLLVCDSEKRRTLAEALSHDFFTHREGRTISKAMPAAAPRQQRGRSAAALDESTDIPLHKGVLWQLTVGGNADNAKDWRRKDVWIANNGSLCYYSLKDRKRLVLIDGAVLATATIVQFQGGAKSPAFEVKLRDESQSYLFAVERPEHYEEWMSKLQEATRLEMPSMHMGAELARELHAFVLNVRNRRMKIGKDVAEHFAPVFKSSLWKVKTEGDKMKEEDWFKREMWIAKNGSLVYWSMKDERELVYYTSQDLTRAVVTRIDPSMSLKPHAFCVKLPPVDGVEFAPGEFAAESQELVDQWIEEIKNVQQAVPGSTVDSN